MLLEAVLFLGIAILLIYFLFLRKSELANRKIKNAPLTILFAVQIFFIIWSYYILKTSEGFDGLLVILTLPPAFILIPVIILLGQNQYKNNVDRSWVNRIIVTINATALISLVVLLVYFMYFAPD